MNCPICLDKLRNSVIFDPCKHSCCQICYTASEIKNYPYCRERIDSISPSPWLDSQDEDLENIEDVDIVNDIVKIKPITDVRGHDLLLIAKKLETKIKPIVSQEDNIVEDKILMIQQHRLKEILKELENNYLASVKRVEKEFDAAVKAIQLTINENLARNTLQCKEQEYYNQNIEYLIQTCLSLSTQPSVILDEVLPIYQSKIEEVSFDWPFDLIPTAIPTVPSLFPNERRDTLLPCEAKKKHASNYYYIPSIENYLHTIGKSLYLKDKSITLVDKTRVEIRVYNSYIYLKSIDDKNTYITIFDDNLTLISEKVFTMQNIKFLVHNGQKIL